MFVKIGVLELGFTSEYSEKLLAHINADFVCGICAVLGDFFQKAKSFCGQTSLRLQRR